MKFLKLPKLPKAAFLFQKQITLVLFAIAFVTGITLVGVQSDVLSWQQLPGVNNWIGVSSVKIHLSGQKIVAQFQIAPRDRENMEQFVRNLGVDDNFVQGVAVSVDGQTAEALAKFLPIEANLKISSRKIEFSSYRQQNIIWPLLGTEVFQSASPSGGLKVENLGGEHFRIEAENPAQVLQEAASSGRLRFSDRLSGDFFQLASKFARIELNIDGRFLKGELVLY